MSEFDCPLSVHADTCMPTWESDLPSRCIECIEVALRKRTTRQNELFSEVDHDKYPPEIERKEQIRMRATTGSYDRVLKVISGPTDSSSGELVQEKLLEAYFNCPDA